MKAKTIVTILMTLFVSQFAVSQSNKCIKDFDFMVKKIKSDYPGYNDKVTDANRSQLMLLEKQLRQKIVNYPDSCGYYLNKYTDFFKDHHLRVSRIRKKNNKQSEVMNMSTYGKNLHVNVDSLQQKTKNTTGIEGVWEGFREKFVVTKDRQTYVGVVLNNQGWQNGQAIYEFEPVNDTVFNVINYSLITDVKPYKTEASLHLNGKIIEFHNNTWFVRKSDFDIFDKSVLYSYVPECPNGLNTFPLAMYLGDSTYYLRIPSFYNNTGNELVKQHWNEITSRPNLIIDIRNNGGGQDQYYQELKKLIYSKPYESKGVEWYASKGNIKSFEDAMEKGEIRNGEEGMRWTQALVGAMKKNIGGFVTHPFDANESEIVEMDTVYSMPRNIGIIINEVNASAAEQFLLFAQQSDKIILFGNASTAGILDYSNITPNPLPSNNYQLWCPMTRSKRLPENPIDNIGVTPDVNIPFPVTEQLYDKLDKWVYFVKNYLELLNTEGK